MEYNNFDIYIAKVRFEDSKKLKIRPVLIISKEEAYIIGSKITTHPPRDNFCGEYEIRDYKEAGLNEPSTIRLSKLLKLTEKDMIKRIGQLSNFDKKNVLELIYTQEINLNQSQEPPLSL